MKIKELEKYKPITIKLRKRLSDHEMKSNSEQFYENISSRHTIRQFNERKIPGEYDVKLMGLNYRLDEIRSQIGITQLKKIDKFITLRKKNYFF